MRFIDYVVKFKNFRVTLSLQIYCLKSVGPRPHGPHGEPAYACMHVVLHVPTSVHVDVIMDYIFIDVDIGLTMVHVTITQLISFLTTKRL